MMQEVATKMLASRLTLPGYMLTCSPPFLRPQQKSQTAART